jgi:hypothetical protein
MFVLASKDEVNAAGECRDGLQRGINVGGLGVVVVLDTVDGGHEFEPVLDGLEALDGAANGFGRDSGEPGGADRRQDVFDVVRTLKRNGLDPPD